jgi:hypothetical protein
MAAALSRFFGILQERAPDFLVYSPCGITGENFKCLFQDDAQPATSEWGSPEPEWTVTGKCDGWDLAPSGTETSRSSK